MCRLAGPGYRIRVGSYPLVYEVDDGVRVVTVAKVGHRRDGYERLSAMPTMVPITEAKARLSELVALVRDEHAGDTVLLMKHGRPAAVVVDAAYAQLLDALEDAEDRLSLLERPGDVVDFDAALAALR